MKRHAIVVGASSGIGAAIVTELMDAGWDVSALARRAPPSDAPSASRWIRCDVTDDASVARAIAEALDGGGTPSALIYSAGVGAFGRTLDVPELSSRSAFEVNFWGVERVVRRVHPVMTAAGAGAIVVVLSIAALRAVPFEAHYGASKAACARWLDCLALESEASGVRVRYLAPGYVPTGFLERAGWHGLDVPVVNGSGVEAADVARAVVAIAEGRRSRAVFGWRENAISLVDRLLPGAYDRVLRGRIRRTRRS